MPVIPHIPGESMEAGPARDNPASMSSRSARPAASRFEAAVRAVRHHPRLERMEPVWRRVRPLYVATLELISPRGLPRMVNSGEAIRVLPRHREVTDTYERRPWNAVLAAIQPGDLVVDV